MRYFYALNISFEFSLKFQLQLFSTTLQALKLYDLSSLEFLSEPTNYVLLQLQFIFPHFPPSIYISSADF